MRRRVGPLGWSRDRNGKLTATAVRMLPVFVVLENYDRIHDGTVVGVGLTMSAAEQIMDEYIRKHIRHDQLPHLVQQPENPRLRKLVVFNTNSYIWIEEHQATDVLP